MSRNRGAPPAYARKRDANSRQIIDELRLRSCRVADLGAAGMGILDLVVEHKLSKAWAFVELKRPGPASARKLKPRQKEFLAHWADRCVVAQSAEEVLSCLKLLAKPAWPHSPNCECFACCQRVMP